MKALYKLKLEKTIKPNKFTIQSHKNNSIRYLIHNVFQEIGKTP